MCTLTVHRAYMPKTNVSLSTLPYIIYLIQVYLHTYRIQVFIFKMFSLWVFKYSFVGKKTHFFHSNSLHTDISITHDINGL